MKTHCLPGVALLLATAYQRPARPAADAAAVDGIDTSKTNPRGSCTRNYAPVCGCDGNISPNACAARNAGVRRTTSDSCPAATLK